MKKLMAFLLLLIGLLQYRLWFGDGNLLKFRHLNERIQELKQEGAKRKERNIALEAEVMDLKQGQDAIEERARQDLGMIKEGEVFVQVIDPHHENEPRQPPPPAAKADVDRPSKRKLWRERHAGSEASPATAEPAENPDATGQ